MGWAPTGPRGLKSSIVELLMSEWSIRAADAHRHHRPRRCGNPLPADRRAARSGYSNRLRRRKRPHARMIVGRVGKACNVSNIRLPVLFEP